MVKIGAASFGYVFGSLVYGTEFVMNGNGEEKK